MGLIKQIKKITIEPGRRYLVRESYLNWPNYPGELWVFVYSDGTVERLSGVRVKPRRVLGAAL